MIDAEEIHSEPNVRNCRGEEPMQTQNTVDANSHAEAASVGFFTRAGEAVKATATNTKVLVGAACVLLGAGLAWGAVKLYQMANEPEQN